MRQESCLGVPEPFQVQSDKSNVAGHLEPCTFNLQCFNLQP
jgi:hypothetical protein